MTTQKLREILRARVVANFDVGVRLHVNTMKFKVDSRVSARIMHALLLRVAPHVEREGNQ